MIQDTFFIPSAPPTVSSLTYDSDARTLTCTSTDSPATNVTWTRDGVTLTVDGTTYSMTQTVTDRRASTYENVLATRDISGTYVYSCLVRNALGDSNTMSVEGKIHPKGLVVHCQTVTIWEYMVVFTGSTQTLTLCKHPTMHVLNILISHSHLSSQVCNCETS